MTAEIEEGVKALIWLEFEQALGFLETQIRGRNGRNGIRQLLNRMSWRLDALAEADPIPFLDTLSTLRTTLLQAVGDPDPASAANTEAAAAIARVSQELEDLFVAFEPALELATEGVLDPVVRQAFVADLVEFLVVEWLLERARPLVLIAEALGVLRWEVPEAITTAGSDPVTLRLPLRRRSLPLLRLVTIALDPLTALAGDGSSPEATFEALQAEVTGILGGLQQRLEGAATGQYELRLTPSSIELLGFDPPLFEAAGGAGAAPIVVPLPNVLAGLTAGTGLSLEPAIVLTPDSLGFAWHASGAASTSAAPQVLLDVSGFRVLVGGNQGAGASLTLSPPVDELSSVTLVASGALRLEMPVEWLANDAGTRLAVGASGTVTATTGPPTNPLAMDFGFDLAQVDATLSGLRIGGASGLLVESGTLALTDLQFPVTSTPGLKVQGSVRIAGALVGVTATLDSTGFQVTSTAQVDLPGGIRFEPVGDAPVLSFAVPFGGGAVTASLAGTVRLPKGDGLESVTFAGSIAFDVTPTGLVVQSVAAAAEVVGSWNFAGDVVVREAAAALVYDASGPDGALFAIELSGKVLVGRGQLDVHQIRFAFTPVGVAFDAELSVNNLDVHDVAQIRSGTLTLAAQAPFDGSPGSGSAKLVGGAADFVQSDTSWLISVDDLDANVSIGGTFRFELTSGLIEFPVPFDGDNPGARALAQVESLLFETDLATVTLTAGFYLATDLVLWSNGGFLLAVAAGTGFALDLGPDTAPLISVTGGARFDISPDALRNVDSVEKVSVAIAGTTTLVLGTQPAIDFSDVDITLGPGTFVLGGADAMRISNATIALRSVERLANPTPDDPFEIAISGRLQLADDGPALSLTDATFLFEGSPLPRFQPGGMGVDIGDFADDLPFRVTAASFELVDPTRPFPESIYADNLRIGMSVELELPLGGDGAGVMARADQVEVDLSGPLPTVTLDGLGMGVDGLSLGVLEVTGVLYVGGLGSLANLPAALTGAAAPGQRPLFVAGKVGGRYNGSKVAVLLAMRPDKPLGACLDVAIDGGIVLAYGFTLNGVSGGVSFANQPGNPCDIKSYIDFAALPPAPSDTGWQQQPGDHSFDGGVAVKPETGCDCNCPPPSMNPLCQPHPDGAMFPGRAILKFSAISEQMLDDWGALALLDNLSGNAQTAVTELIGEIRTGLEPMVPSLPDSFPLPAGTPPDLVAIARQPVDAILNPLHDQLVQVAGDSVVGLRARLLDALWAGIECPDITLQVTGTFSYTGIGYFLTVTGGVNIGTTGAGGILGSLNLFGMPIGTLRAFISGTDEQGMPRTGLCGDLDLSFGPFDFGRLCLTASVPSLETVLLQAAVEHLPRLLTIGSNHGPAVLEALLAEVDLDATTSPGTLDERLARIDLDAAVGIVSRLASGGIGVVAQAAAGAASDPAIHAWLGDLFVTLWDGYDPSLMACGVVQPKIFGFPLSGELATLTVSGDKHRITASTSFSLGSLVASLFGGAGAFFAMPTDYVTLAMSCGFPDPIGVGIETFLELGQNSANPGQSLVDNLGADVDRMLEETLFAVGVSIRPFGLEFADSQSRIIIPDLLHYPDTAWAPPTDRPAVLAAALAEDLIIEPTWTGDLQAIPALATSHAGQDLRSDYFPHGGWLGAGVMALPRLLAEAPPVELIGRIIDNEDVLDRLGALATFCGEWIAEMTEIGTMSFYVPAPAPPVGLTGSLVEQIGQMASHLSVGAVRSDLFFASGELTLSLFGVDLGTAQARMELPGPGAPGRLEISAVVNDPWLASIVGTAQVTATITTPPPLPLGLYFGLVQELIGLAASGQLTRPRIDTAIATAATAHVDEPDRRAQVRELLAASFSGLSTTGTAADRQAALATALGDVMADMLPKVAFEAQAAGLSLPAPFDSLFSVGSARLVSYSPWFDPTATGDDPLAQAKRFGGVGVEVLGASVDVFGWQASLDRFVLSVSGGPGGVPLFNAVVQASSINLPGFQLTSAELDVSNQGAARAALRVRGTELDFGWGRLQPWPQSSSSATTAELALDIDLLNGTARLDPCVLVPPAGIGVVAADIVLHGATENEPFTFDRSGPWSAGASVDRLEIDAPGGSGATWTATDVANVAFEGDGLALTKISGSLDVAVDTIGPIVISGVQLFEAIDVGVATTVHAVLAGFDGAMTATVAGSLSWQGQQLSFDSGSRDFQQPTLADLRIVLLDGLREAFERLFMSFDVFVQAINSGWVAWQFDAVTLANQLTQVYRINGIVSVTAALVQLPLTTQQIDEVLRSLFSWVPHVDLPFIEHGDAWLGTVATETHADAVLVPHGDAEIGAHADGVLHGDVATGHADIASVHGDQSASAHIDQAPSVHGDVQGELHGDASGIGHLDTPRGPHADIGFGVAHGDGRVPPHGDISGSHVDISASPHVDAAASVHADLGATVHGDTSSPHVDGPGPPPHGDLHTHVDVVPVHVDTVEAHIDEVVHADLPGVHWDQALTDHSDAPAGFSDPGHGGGHADAPAVSHLDRAAIPHGDSTEELPWHLDTPARRHGDIPFSAGSGRPPGSGPPGGTRPGSTRPPPARPGPARPAPTRPGSTRPPAARPGGTAPGGRSRGGTGRLIPGPDGLGDPRRGSSGRDLSRLRVGRQHVDQAAEPHGDAPKAAPHLDVSAVPHGDIPAQPHVDSA